MKWRFGARARATRRKATEVPRASLKAVIDYVWEDAYEDFMNPEAQRQPSHIFRSIADLYGWLHDQPRVAEEYLFTRIRRVQENDHFGGCPQCFQETGRLYSDKYIDVGREHWFVCRQHRNKWCAGANLFGSWREHTEATAKINRRRLRSHTEVTPVHRRNDGEEV